MFDTAALPSLATEARAGTRDQDEGDDQLFGPRIFELPEIAPANGGGKPQRLITDVSKSIEAIDMVDQVLEEDEFDKASVITNMRGDKPNAFNTLEPLVKLNQTEKADQKAVPGNEFGISVGSVASADDGPHLRIPERKSGASFGQKFQPVKVEGQSKIAPVSYEKKTVNKQHDTVKERNDKIEEYQPFEYNHIKVLENVQHIQNIDDKHITMNILENEETVPAEKDEAKDNYKINLMSGDGAAGGSGEIYTDTSTTPVICNGNLFSVVSIFTRSKKSNPNRIQRTSIAVFKHHGGTDTSEKLFEHEQWCNTMPHNWHNSARRSTVNQNKLYWCSFQNDFQYQRIHHQIWRFDFETGERSIIYARIDKMYEDVNIQQLHYACQSMLSIYVPTDDKGNIDLNQEIDEDKFIQKTFVSVRYRCAKKDEMNKSMRATKRSKSLRISFKSAGSNADNDSESEQSEDGLDDEEESMNRYYSTMKVYQLKNFSKQNEKPIKSDEWLGGNGYKDYEIIPQIQFVKGDKYYVVKHRSKTERGFMDIEKEEADNESPEEPRIKLSMYQDANDLDKETSSYFHEYFLKPYALYNVNDGCQHFNKVHLIAQKCWNEQPADRRTKEQIEKSKKKKGAKVVDEASQKPDLVPFYHSLAERFNLCEESDDIQSMNLIYNVTESPPRLYITAVKKNQFIIKRIVMDDDFTRITRQAGNNACAQERLMPSSSGTKIALWGKAKQLVLRDLKKDIDYGRTIRYDDLVLSIKGGENKGIFIQIYNKNTNEILLSEMVQSQFTHRQFLTSTLCWCSEAAVGGADKSVKKRHFLVAIMDQSMQICQLLEYKVTHHSNNLKERLIRKSVEGVLSSMTFLSFLRKAHQVISLEVVGMNLIILNEPYEPLNPNLKAIALRPIVDDKQQITGSEWSDKNFTVKINPRDSSVFQINSDIAKSMYKKYHIGNEQHPRLIHIQSVLSDKFEKIGKDPYLDALLLINSIKNSSSTLYDMLNTGHVFGVKASQYVKLLRKLREKSGLNQMDRFVILKNQIKTILNMQPINYQDFTLYYDKTDLLQPNENLSCETECDFFLNQPTHIALELIEEVKIELMPSLVTRFITDNNMKTKHKAALEESLDDLCYSRDIHQIVFGLYNINPILRCLQRRKPCIQSAKILLNLLLSKRIQTTERDIIMSSLVTLCNCEYEPFAFDMLSKFMTRPKLQQDHNPNTQEVSLCQFLQKKDTILFNNNIQETHMLEQRNFAGNSLYLKQNIAIEKLEYENENTPPDMLNIPVDHVVIDFHSTFVTHKIQWIQKELENQETVIEQKIQKFVPYTTQEIIYMINDRYGKDMEKQLALQRIIDAQFVTSWRYFFFLFALYSCGFIIPFIIQMNMEGNGPLVEKLCTSCVVVCITFQILDIIEFKTLQKKIDWFDFYNVMNNIVYFSYYYYYNNRMKDPSLRVLPSESSGVSYENQSKISLITIVILSGMTVKSMELVRFDKRLGQLVKLVIAVIKDVRNLFLFIIYWIFMFTLFYEVLGFETDRSLDEMSLWQYFIISWKVATKGSDKNVASFWQRSGDIQDQFGFMDTFIMIVQIMNEVYLKIIMLSFLIAIVKKSFDEQMKAECQNRYNSRCDQNLESSNVMRQIGLLDESDIIVLSATFEDFAAFDKFAIFQKDVREELTQLKQKIDDQPQQLEEFKSQISKEMKELKQLILDIKK